MLSVYPFGSGSLYTASYAISSSYATSASFIAYVISASNAATILYPQAGARGKSVCLLTKVQFDEMVSPGKQEICNFPS